MHDESGLAGLSARWAAEASIEATTRNLADIDGYAALRPRGAEVSIPWLPGEPFHHTVSVAQRLREAGLEPVPHLAARRLDSQASTQAWLERLVAVARIDRVVLIAGDAERPAGPFEGACDVIDSGLLQAHGIRRVGLGAYPEGHPLIEPERLWRTLEEKVSAARQAGLEVDLITQFCFEGEPLVQWLRALRSRGIAVPVRIGLAGPASIRSLLIYARRCGIGRSIRAVWSGPVSLRDLMGRHGPDDVMVDLARAVLAEPALGPVDLHLYSFGGFKASADWLAGLAAGTLADRILAS
jgi:methylenetetrahydrofolate reductase (NADPH)